jgi:cell division protein ZapA
MANKTQPDASGYITVSIYDQTYHLRGQNPDHIRHLADMVDSKMRAVAAQGRTVDSLRVAVLAALNLADELSQTSGVNAQEGRARAAHLQNMLDEILEGDRKTGS